MKVKIRFKHVKNLFLLFVSLFAIKFFLFSNSRSSKGKTNLLHKNQTKHVLFICTFNCGGWADRLKGIMSAYAFSLLTNRHFSIYIDNPCYLTSLVIPNTVDWNSKLISNGQDLKLLESYSIRELNGDQRFIVELKTQPLSFFDSDEDIIVIRTGQNWLYSLSYNVNLKDRIKQIGYEPQDFKLQLLFKKWYKQLFKLAPGLKVKYDFYVNISKKSSQTKIVCSQIRIGGEWDDMVFYPMNVTRIFWRFIKEKLISKEMKKSGDYRIFVISDTEKVVNEAFVEFGAEKMIHIFGDFVHIDKDWFDLKENCSNVEKVLLDFEFIQTCDSVVVSDSNFGKMSSLLRKNPTKEFFIYYNHNNFVKINDIAKHFVN